VSGQQEAEKFEGERRGGKGRIRERKRKGKTDEIVEKAGRIYEEDAQNQ
jgi:hypothetical protein